MELKPYQQQVINDLRFLCLRQAQGGCLAGPFHYDSRPDY